MDVLSASDIALLKFGAAGCVASLARSYSSYLLSSKKPKPSFPLLNLRKASKTKTIAPTRSIKKCLDETRKNAIIFYGSQTGTAEKFALRLSKQASTKYNLDCLVADLDDYDYTDLASLSPQQIVIFVLATYGDGEPTDNAIAFNRFIDQSTSSLDGINYAAFGLGSSSYPQFNAMIRRVDDFMHSRGGVRLGPLGIGDDGKGTLDDDYITWSQEALAAIANCCGFEELEYRYKASFDVKESADHTSDVFLGEPNKAHLHQRVRGPFTSQNPLPARIVEAKELMSSASRHCLHVEFDTSGTTLSYDTGDHLAVWPVNSDEAVDSFLHMFGLHERQHTVVDITSHDPSVKVPIPAKTTYAAAVRHYLDINAPVSRQFLAYLAAFAPSPGVSDKLIELSNNRESFQRCVIQPRLSLVQALQSLVLDGASFARIPFSFVLENVAKLQPRFYSISSSSHLNKNRIAITAVVDADSDAKKVTTTNPTPSASFKGVCTSYLHALSSQHLPQQQPSSPSSSSVNTVDHHLSTHHLLLPSHARTTSPSSALSPSTTMVLIHTRRSTFRLPRPPNTPIIMIGPGTGVAPFRAFVQERLLQHRSGRSIGRTILFYGCRSQSEFLYADEWTHILEEAGVGKEKGWFDMHTGYSREQVHRKQYVQHLLVEQAEEVKRLVLQEGAYVYVCGDAGRMAKDVGREMRVILGVGDEDVGGAAIAEMRREKRWCEDVW